MANAIGWRVRFTIGMANAIGWRVGSSCRGKGWRVQVTYLGIFTDSKYKIFAN